MQEQPGPITPPEKPAGFIEELELQRLLPLSRRTLANHRKAGLIPFVRIGRRNLYHWATIEQSLLRRQKGVAE
jgi:hypothetical protein